MYSIKLKTKKSVKKRIIIKKKNLFYKHAYKNHFMRRKTSSHLNRLLKIGIINNNDYKNLYRLLPYI